MLLSFFRKKLDPGIPSKEEILNKSITKDTTEIRDTIYGIFYELNCLVID